MDNEEQLRAAWEQYLSFVQDPDSLPDWVALSAGDRKMFAIGFDMGHRAGYDSAVGDHTHVIKLQLEAVELQITARLITATLASSPSSRRAYLIALDKSGELVEDELVADWHELYAQFEAFGKSDG